MGVAGRVIVVVDVLRSVRFDDQARSEAYEVDDVLIEPLLLAEFPASQASASVGL
jgi:hypothetical protein